MALSKIKTASITADAVDNTILDLTDTYAFTGTVTGAGALALVHSATVTSGSTIDWTGATTAYNQYLVFYNIDPASDTAINVQVYDDASTPALKNGASDYGRGAINEGGASAVNTNTAQVMSIHTGMGGASANEFCSGYFYFINPMNSSFFTTMIGCANADNTSGSHVVQWFAGQRLAAEQNKGFQLQIATGTITNAEIKIFGMG